MSLTLAYQMDSVFDHGLKVIQKYEEPVMREWKNILLQLQKTSNRSIENMETAVHFYADFFFKPHNTENHTEFGKNSLTPAQLVVSLEINQSFITLLENAVHKIVQTATHHSYEDHQAVQYVFAKISEEILAHPHHNHFAIDTFLQDLVSSNQLPIEWTAIVISTENNFTVEKWFNHLNQDLLLGNDFLKADSIFALSELLLDQMEPESRKKFNVLPIAHDDATLLFCIENRDTSHVVPFITYALQIFREGHDTVKTARQEQQWKDSVILFHEMIMRSETYQEAVENITAGFVNYLPFERCALFSYSMNDQMGFGLYGHRLENEAIQSINEDIGNLPIIQSNLDFLNIFGKNMKYLQPIYVKDASIGFPDQYIRQFDLRSVVVAPIFTTTDNKLLGAAILDQGPGKYFKLAQETFSALIRFGQSAGQILSKYSSGKLEPEKAKSVQLSPREIDVLKLMAEGASTSEAADNLHLSEYTVRDYVSAIMQKMGARNRTEAVARAIREGMI